MMSPIEDGSTTMLLDINNSTARTLMKTIGVTPTMARKIISYKRQKGWYDHIGELWRIKQMTMPFFEAITSKYTVYRQHTKKPSRRLQGASKGFARKRKTPDRDSDISGRRRIDSASRSVSRTPNKVSVKMEKGKRNVTGKNQRETRGSKEAEAVELPQIRMAPVAVNRSVSGNIVMVTYKAMSHGTKLGTAETSQLVSKGDKKDGTTQINLSEPRMNGNTTPGGPLTAQQLKTVEKSDENPNLLKSIERWISDVNDAGAENEQKKVSNQKKYPQKTQTNELETLSMNPMPGPSDAKVLEGIETQDTSHHGSDEGNLRRHVETQRNNTKSKKIDTKSEKMDNKSEKNRFENPVPGTSGVKNYVRSKGERDKALPVDEIRHSKRKTQEAERHRRHKRHHSDRKDRRNEGRSPDVVVEKHRRSHRHDRHKRESKESAEISDSVCQVM